MARMCLVARVRTIVRSGLVRGYGSVVWVLVTAGFGHLADRLRRAMHGVLVDATHLLAVSAAVILAEVAAGRLALAVLSVPGNHPGRAGSGIIYFGLQV